MKCHLLAGVTLIFALTVTAAEPPNEPPRAAGEKSAAERAWDDLRWLTTALEAYSTDNDSLYAPTDGNREGAVSALDALLEWYYENTFPKKDSPPHVDPWGREYRFVVSADRRNYALYSVGPDEKLGEAERLLLERVRNNSLSVDDLRNRRTSRAIIVVSGTILFAPPEVLRILKPLANGGESA